MLSSLAMGIMHIAPKMVFGRLTTVKFAFYRNNKQYWECLCSCGNNHTTDIYSLSNASTQSCGCLQRERAGAANTIHGASAGYRVNRLYRIWSHMRQRCTNPNDTWFCNYGARGVRVCPEWDNYPTFRDWALQNGYRDNLTIERKERAGNYEPNNCCWIPKGQQSSNTNRNIRITAWGETKLLKRWSEDPRCSVSYISIRKRIKKGWTPERAISEPNPHAVPIFTSK